MECDLHVNDRAHIVPFSRSKTPHCFSTLTGTVFSHFNKGKVTFRFCDCWFNFLLLFLFRCRFSVIFFAFGGFLFRGCGVPIYTFRYTLAHLPSKTILSSNFRFLVFEGITAISLFGMLFPLTLSAFVELLAAGFSFPQVSICCLTACRIMGRMQVGQETKSGVSFIGIFPNVTRSRGSSCFTTGDPTSELGGDWFPCWTCCQLVVLERHTSIRFDFAGHVFPFRLG